MAFALAALSGQALAELKPGLWEWTSQLKMPGVPMAMPPSVHQACLTKDDLVPKERDPQSDCKLGSVKQQGERVEWSMTCDTPQGQVSSRGEMVYRGESASGVSYIETGGMQMTSKMQGRRLGNCP